MREFSANVVLDEDAAERIEAVVERYHRGDLQEFIKGAFLRGLIDSVVEGEDLTRAGVPSWTAYTQSLRPE